LLGVAIQKIGMRYQNHERPGLCAHRHVV
jgi:hypothetical protein